MALDISNFSKPQEDPSELPASVVNAISASQFFPGVVVADRTWSNAYDGVLGGSFKSNSACVYKARGPVGGFITELRPMFYHQNADSIASMVDLEFTVALEYPIGATRLPFFFNKKRTVILSPGAVVFADPLEVEIPVGNEYAIWVYGSPLGSGIIRGPGAVLTGVTNPDRVDLGATSTSQVDSGTITNSTGGMQAPQAVFGRLVDSTGKKVARVPQPLIIGDSIAEYGQDDRTLRRNPGWVNRWMDANGPIAHINVAKSGENAQSWGATQANQLCRYRKIMLGAATSVLYAEGVNDIHTRTTAQIQADMLACATMAFTRGLPFWPCTVTPLPTSSSDGFLTVANQTANAGNDAARVPYNNWLRAGCPIDPSTKAAVAIGTGGALIAGSAGHPVSGFIEIADLVESARDSGKWAAAAASGTATWANNSTSLTSLTTATGTWANGQFIKGTGIPALTTISALNIGAGTATMSYAGTPAGTAAAVWSPLTTDGTHPSQTGIAQIVANVSIPAALIA